MHRILTPEQPNIAMQEDTIQPLKPDAPSADQSKYLLYSRPEITAILGTLAKSGTMVTAYFNEGKDFILTSIVAVRPDLDKLFVEYGADDASNRRALQAGKIMLVAAHQRIKIQFTAESPQRARLGDREVLSLALPATLLRLQRREYFRIATLLTRPLRCTIAPQPGKKQASVEVTIVDISCGGIALVDCTDPIKVLPGARFRGCRIPLPELGEVIADIEVRSTFEVTYKDGSKHRRVGCEFIGMRERDRALIQRYISRLERERKDRAVGR